MRWERLRSSQVAVGEGVLLGRADCRCIAWLYTEPLVLSSLALTALTDSGEGNQQTTSSCMTHIAQPHAYAHAVAPQLGGYLSPRYRDPHITCLTPSAVDRRSCGQ